jgi:hypothetical protein
MLPMSLLLSLLLACGPGPVTDHVAPACAHDVDGWYGGLARHLGQRERGGGFDYPAPEAWVGGYLGRWERHGGSFVALTRFERDYYLQTETQIGSGWFGPDGDYSLSWAQWSLDALGVVQQSAVREQRQGCVIEQRARSGDATVTTEAEILDADTVAGTVLSTASDFDIAATWRSDFSAELSYAGHDGESWYEMVKPGDGTLEASYHLAYDGGVEDGAYTRDFDGAREYRFDRTPDEGDWEVLHIWWLLRYDGSGEGEVIGEGVDGSTLTCWYEWDAEGVGSYTCDDGSSGPY